LDDRKRERKYYLNEHVHQSIILCHSCRGQQTHGSGTDFNIANKQIVIDQLQPKISQPSMRETPNNTYAIQQVIVFRNHTTKPPNVML
jgi:hypothetical protein